MRKISSFNLFLLGLLSLTVGVYFLHLFGEQSARTRRVWGSSISPFQQIDTGEIGVSTEMPIKVEIELHVDSTSVHRNDGYRSRFRRNELQYQFPFEYSVIDPNGSVIHQEKTAIAWDDTSKAFQILTNVNSARGWALVQSKFGSFTATTGRIRVLARLSSDNEFNSTASDVKLSVYDNVYPSTPFAIAILTLCISSMLFLVSLVGFVTERLCRNDETEVETTARLLKR